jgi:CheY-like chemotaxis protein/anti-sigma regulatory factor (Ser/Thr protein kinase)
MILRLPSEIVRFKADEARLEQITINLMNNASKYTARGGWIELSGVREGSEIVIRCKDNGRGIAHEMQQKIFEPFTRIEPFSESHGEASLGIGLALAKRLVELHGGTIVVESSGPGMGSAFVVRLPLESAAPDQPAVGETKPVSTSRHSRLIVVIEDNSDMAAAMLVALERAGYRVTRFGNAFSALAGLSTLKPYAVLLDIGLPGMDGYKLAATLRQKPHLRHAMFIGLSGFKRREATERGDNFDHYFNKPLDLPALLTVLDSFTPPAATEGQTVRRIMEKVEPIRVLLVDDHAELLAATAALLHQEGLDVLTVQSGREGLDALQDFSPQLILCDLNLSDMPGQEVIRLLRSNSPNQHIYAVVLTAASSEEILELNREAATMGVDEFISKPLMSEAIRMLVSKLKRKE